MRQEEGEIFEIKISTEVKERDKKPEKKRTSVKMRNFNNYESFNLD